MNSRAADEPKPREGFLIVLAGRLDESARPGAASATIVAGRKTMENEESGSADAMVGWSVK